MVLPYKAPVPSAIPTINDDEIVSAMKKFAEQFNDQGNTKIANNITKYLQNRTEYVKDYKDKYALISDKGIDVTNITTLSNKDTGFGENNGILVKIGREIEPKPLFAMYTRNYNVPTQVYTLPISFGNRLESSMWTSNVEAVVDTGCSTTTFDKSVLNWIQTQCSYTTTTVRIGVVGGQTDVQAATIDLDLCGVPHSIQVHYATLNLNGPVALIGTDLLNSGKLDVECGTRLSFTRH